MFSTSALNARCTSNLRSVRRFRCARLPRPRARASSKCSRGTRISGGGMRVGSCRRCASLRAHERRSAGRLARRAAASMQGFIRRSKTRAFITVPSCDRCSSSNAPAIGGRLRLARRTRRARRRVSSRRPILDGFFQVAVATAPEIPRWRLAGDAAFAGAIAFLLGHRATIDARRRARSQVSR